MITWFLHDKSFGFFFSISHSNRQLNEVANVTLYTHLQELVKRAYPNLAEEQWDTVYQNILACMEFKNSVRLISPKYLIQGNSEVARSAIKCLSNIFTLDFLYFLLFVSNKQTPLFGKEAG